MGYAKRQVQITFEVEKIWISQNHRMFGVGRDLCGSSSPTLLPADLLIPMVNSSWQYCRSRI